MRKSYSTYRLKDLWLCTCIFDFPVPPRLTWLYLRIILKQNKNIIYVDLCGICVFDVVN